MTVRVCIVLSLVACLASPLVAQSGDGAGAQPEGLGAFEPRRPAGPMLTLDAALDEALAQNPTLVALRRQFDVARLRPAQARYLMAPTFEAQIWQWPIATFDPADANMYMFMVRQEIPGRGKRDARAALLEADAAVAESHIGVRAREVVDEVKRAYADLFLARKTIDVRLESIGLVRQLADVSAARYATGGISQQDVLKAVVELSMLHDGLVLTDEQARLAEARLNTLLDRAPDTPVGTLAEPTEQVDLPAPAELQRMALDRHPEIRRAVLARERAEAGVAVAELGAKPDFFVGGGYMLMPAGGDAWSANVGITWPRAPWSRGRIDAQVAEARAEVDAAAARQRAIENAIRLAVQDAHVRVQSASRRAMLLRTSVLPQSEQTLEVSRVAYQADRVPFLALIDNQRVLLDARLDYYEALSDLEQAMADLERAAGVDFEPGIVGDAAGVGPQPRARTP